MPQEPRFVLGTADQVATQTLPDYPEYAPSDLIVVEARFGVLSMVVTPTCHVSEGEKDEDIVAVVPVEALNMVVPDINDARDIRKGKNVPLHLFPLPITELGEGILPFRTFRLDGRSLTAAAGSIPASAPGASPSMYVRGSRLATNHAWPSAAGAGHDGRRHQVMRAPADPTLRGYRRLREAQPPV